MIPNKHILLSKTFWINFTAGVALLLPAVQKWLSENPVEIGVAFAALNILVRFATSGKVNIFGPEEGREKQTGGGILPGLCLGLSTAAALSMAGTLPSCSPNSAFPVTGTLSLRDPESGAKAGLVFQPGKPAAGMVKMPIEDGEGRVIGYVDLKSGK